MISFIICLLALIAAYFIYGPLLEKVMKIDPKAQTPSTTMADGTDYIAMPRYKTFLIQFLNIAGLGPIFGAILGATYGPVAFVWITLGGIFLGGVQDFTTGVISIKNGGMNFPDIVGKYLGRNTQLAMRVLTLILMILVGAVFMTGPAAVLSGYTGIDNNIWLVIIFAYYILATVLPIDKIIGKVYPIFGIVLFLMAFLMLYVIFFKGYSSFIPEISFENMKFNKEDFPIIPTMLVTIACGAISGFHTTQSPLMARCMKSESECKPVFYGSMICESIIALIWAAIAMSFFGGTQGLNEAVTIANGNAASIIDTITSSSLGVVGVALIILGVVFAPISTGDTALRMARLISADFIKINQKKIKGRILLSLPIFAIAYTLTQIDFDIIWRYFAWFNQVIAVFALWTVTVYLQRSKYMIITLIPALIMTFVVTLYILISPDGFMIDYTISAIISGAVTIGVLILFLKKSSNRIQL